MVRILQDFNVVNILNLFLLFVGMLQSYFIFYLLINMYWLKLTVIR